MKTHAICLGSHLLAATLTCCFQSHAQPNYDTNNVAVQTFAGSGFYGYYDGQGVLTMFNGPSQVVTDSSSNLFVLDSGNSLIRKITPDATVSTYFSLAGLYASGPLLIDHSNALWLVSGNYTPSLLRIGAGGFSTLSLPFTGYYSSVGGLAVDSANRLYVSDAGGNKIYRLEGGAWEVFAGSGNPGALDGNWIFSSFYYPRSLAIDAADNVFVWDSNNHLIRRINQNLDVVTVAGGACVYPYPCPDLDGVGMAAEFNTVNSMQFDNAGSLLLACGLSIRRMTPTTNVLTVAGSFDQAGYTNGPGPVARFKNAAGLCVLPGRIFVADSSDHRIREITFNPSQQPVSGSSLSLSTFAGLQIAGVVGRSYRIESSTNLADWIAEATLLLTHNPGFWLDPNGLAQKKFYRAFLLP